jgi:hypothetical protein
MPRSPAQSDFSVTPSVPEPAPIAGPIAPGTDVVELPRVVVRTPFASARSTFWVMTFTWLVLGVLAILTLVGPHIPAGE